MPKNSTVFRWRGETYKGCPNYREGYPRCYHNWRQEWRNGQLTGAAICVNCGKRTTEW